MAQQSTMCMLGLEMANPATSRGMIQVLQSLQPIVPEFSDDRRQWVVTWCDQNFYERGLDG